MEDKRIEAQQDALQRAADEHAANVLPVIRELQRVGATSLRDIADALNARGMTTAGGRAWFATSVSNVLARARRPRG
jgi:Recombinase